MKVDFVSSAAASTPSLLALPLVLVLLTALTDMSPAHGAEDVAGNFRFSDDDDKKPPNIIVVQPDDFPFLNEWMPPPENPIDYKGALAAEAAAYPARNGLPNIERLRAEGLQMLQAYAASPMCGTSRFSTITGRYPSRSGFGRYYYQKKYQNRMKQNKRSKVASVRHTAIDSTKLEDKPGQPKDCSEQNLAMAFKNNGYATAMVGKWHLTHIDEDCNYSYEDSVKAVKACGFDTVGGLYVENMGGKWYEGNERFGHNMEWLAHEAVEFIKESAEKDQPFFLYFNPTVPHPLVSVERSLKEFSCRDTAAGRLPSDPVVKGMTDRQGGCDTYRKTIYSRATGPDEYGAIWLDDSVGALLTALEDAGRVEDTLFLFQGDHGTYGRGKETLYEGGVRTFQFVRYPAEIAAGTALDAPVSTVDVAPTLMDYAGISPPYALDGRSWRDVVAGDDAARTEYWNDERCLFFEIGYGRAVRCGCYKYLTNGKNHGKSKMFKWGSRFGLSNNRRNLFNLCGGNSSEYVTSCTNNREVINEIKNEPVIAKKLANKLICHIRRTDPGKENNFSECGNGYKPSSFDGNSTASHSGLKSGRLISRAAVDGDRNLWYFSYAFLICIVCYFLDLGRCRRGPTS